MHHGHDVSDADKGVGVRSKAAVKIVNWMAENENAGAELMKKFIEWIGTHKPVSEYARGIFEDVFHALVYVRIWQEAGRDAMWNEPPKTSYSKCMGHWETEEKFESKFLTKLLQEAQEEMPNEWLYKTVGPPKGTVPNDNEAVLKKNIKRMYSVLCPTE